MREPHSGVCEVCGQPVIVARLDNTPEPIVLDPSPVAGGPYRAFYAPAHGWVAGHASLTKAFLGSRRAEHVCPDVQLAL